MMRKTIFPVPTISDRFSTILPPGMAILGFSPDSQELQRFHSRFLYLRLASLFSKIDGFPASFQLGHHSFVAFAKPNPTKTPPQPNTFRHISFTFFNINRRKHTMTSHTQKSRTTPSRQNNTPLRIQRFFPANIQWNVPPQSNNKINSPTKHQQTMKQHEKNNHRHFGSVTIIPWIWVEHQQICHGFSPHFQRLGPFSCFCLCVERGSLDAGAQLALAQAGARRPSAEKAPKMPENHGETMGQMHKNVGFTRKNAGFTKEHIFVFNGEFFWFRGLEMGVVGISFIERRDLCHEGWGFNQNMIRRWWIPTMYGIWSVWNWGIPTRWQLQPDKNEILNYGILGVPVFSGTQLIG